MERHALAISKIRRNMNIDLRRLARHESAHFVTAWAADCPSYQVDITPAARRVCRDDESMMIMGQNYSTGGMPTPFDHILVAIAGPVADNWDGNDTLGMSRDEIDRALKSIADGAPLDEDDGDWDEILRQLIWHGVDVTDEKSLLCAIELFDEAARAILRSCEKPWNEAMEYLIAHGRIGFDGDRPDQGEGASVFFERWGGDWGEPSEDVQSLIAKYRHEAEGLARCDMEILRPGEEKEL